MGGPSLSARGSVTYVQTIQPTDTNWGPSTPGTEPLVFQQFNPTANPTETLTQIIISVQFSETNTYSMTFTNPSTISVTAIDPADKIFAPTIAADTASGQWPLSSYIPSLQVQDPSGLLTKTVTEGPGATYPLTLNSAALGTISIPPTAQNTTLLPGTAGFNAFIGSGTLAFPFIAQGGSTFTSSSGNGSGSVTTEAGVTMSVTYVTKENSIVPEPASLVLLGLGACGALIVRHRRRTAA